MKKLLVISPFKIYPTYAGFDTRVYNIIKQLSMQHKIFFMYVNFNKYGDSKNENFLPNVVKNSFRTQKRWMQLFHPSLILNGVSIINNEKIDLIIGESIWAGLNSIILHIITGVPFYLVEQNFEYIRWKRMGKKYSSILKAYEKLCCKLADKIICVSDEDKRAILGYGANYNIVVIPNGFDPEKFKPDKEVGTVIRNKYGFSSSIPILLFFGALDYIPNFQAIMIIHDILLKKILYKIPKAKILIVGSNPPLQYRHEDIFFTGPVERIEDYINASDVVICPLISGGGTKLKVVEALACGKTVVTTSIGAEGLINEETEGFLRIADDWDMFVEEIIIALQTHERHDISKEFIKKYSWENIGRLICGEI